jgi:hypothetical protein
MVGSECLTPIQASQGYPLELLAAKIGRLLICKDWSAAASCTAGPRKRCVKNGALNFEGARRFQQIRGIMAPGRGRWGSFHIHERGKATRSPVDRRVPVPPSAVVVAVVWHGRRTLPRPALQLARSECGGMRQHGAEH